MDWYNIRIQVNAQVTHWRSVGKNEWADALEECLAKADRCDRLQEVILDLRQRLEQGEREQSP